jgi:hypothetical protein
MTVFMLLVPCALVLLQGGGPPEPRPVTVVVGVVTSVVGREVPGGGIVSDVTIAVDETIKGRAPKSLTIEVVGGTVRKGEETERNSASSNIDVPEEGDKIVVLLDVNHKPTKTHRNSLLILDQNDRVRGTGKTLWDLRREVLK